MSSGIDLNVLPVIKHIVPDPAGSPGVRVAGPPRRAARGRHSDQIILYLELVGNAPLPANQGDQLLQRLVETYYKTSGSATAAIRSTAEALNQYLLDRNRRGATGGKQAVGLFSVLTLRDDHIFIGHSGPMHAFLVNSQGVEHIYDYSSANRGLGLGRTTPIYYSQAMLEAGDMLLVTSQPGASWASGGLAGLHTTRLEKLVPQLQGQANGDLEALIIKANQGSGTIHLVDSARPQAGEAQQGRPIPSPAPANVPAASAPAEPGVAERPAPVVGTSPAAPPRQEAVSRPQPGIPQPEPAPVAQPEQPAQAPRRRRERLSLAPVFQVLLAFGRAIGSTTSGATQSLRTSLGRVLPDESLFTLPASVMAFIAVAVPIVVVAIASVVYLQRGRTAQYMVSFAQASQAAGYARTLTDPTATSDAWNTVISLLDEAEKYKITSESLELRNEAQATFDQLDIVLRLDFLPAINTNLPDSANITSMISFGADLYILDSANGRVSRAISSVRGYQMDEDFLCEQSSFPNPNAGIVDISAATPGNTAGATLLALNQAGGLIACIPGSPPVDTGLRTPAANWSSPSALTTNRGSVYFLDPGTRSVWIYWNGAFDQPPDPFFNGTIPEIDDAIDLAVDRDDLYILHADGHVTLCTYSSFAGSPTHCDAMPYLDSRTGRENQVMVPATAYTQIQTSDPPDPSLYLLDPGAPSLHHFSLRLLNYQRQFRPLDTNSFQINDPSASAFALNSDQRQVFMASGNRVLYAALP